MTTQSIPFRGRITQFMKLIPLRVREMRRSYGILIGDGYFEDSEGHCSPTFCESAPEVTLRLMQKRQLHMLDP